MENIIYKYSSLYCPPMVLKQNGIGAGQIIALKKEKKEAYNPKQTSEEGNFFQWGENGQQTKSGKFISNRLAINVGISLIIRFYVTFANALISLRNKTFRRYNWLCSILPCLVHTQLMNNQDNCKIMNAKPCVWKGS